MIITAILTRCQEIGIITTSTSQMSRQEFSTERKDDTAVTWPRQDSFQFLMPFPPVAWSPGITCVQTSHRDHSPV